MPIQPCPACARPTPKLLESSSQIAIVNYYACKGCHHVWTTSKTTGEFIRHITVLQTAQVSR